MKSEKKSVFKNTALGLFLLIMIIPMSVSTTFASYEPFPEYEAIKPNVLFWKKIYTEYTSSQGVVHDKYDVNMIYEIIDLLPYQHPNAREVNKIRMKEAKNKYKEILKNLSTGKLPTTAEERRVAAIIASVNKKKDLLHASYHIRCQVGQKDRFREGLIRSGAYIDEIKQIFVSYGLPEDLSYLPHVESSFNVKAYSKFGAAGIWQFTRSTGRQFMRVNYTIDERRDPILSSVAAAKFLRQNYEKLGNWPMAITAYNYGAAGMQKAKEEKGDYESIFKHYSKGWFKFASRNFYSEFLAAMDVAKNYHQYFKDITLDSPQKKKKVILSGYASFSEIADHLKIDPEILRKHNPALREPVFLEQKYVPKGYRLLLPQDAGNPIVAEVNLPPHLYKSQQKHSEFYRVQKGDTAGKIAKRHDVRLNDLILANNLNKNAVIYVDQNLRIPRKGEKLRRPAGNKTSVPEKVVMPFVEERKSIEVASVLEAGIVRLQEETVIEDAPMPEIKIAQLVKSLPDKPFPVSQGNIVPISAGSLPDNLEQIQDDDIVIIAQTDDKIDDINNTQPVNPSVVTGNIGVISTGNEKGKEIGYIQVEVEETIGHYADWLKVTASEIRRLNGFKFQRMIRLHEKIKIPLNRVGKTEFEEKRFEYHKEIEEDFFASYRIDGFQTYMVKKGDNIWSLCYEKFDLPIWLVRNCNVKLDFTNLLASQELLVPQVIAIQ